MSNLETIANGESDNVFTGTSDALAALALEIVDQICASGLRSAPQKWRPAKIVNKFIYEAASKFVDQFKMIPSWIPQYDEWKAGKIQHFTYVRRADDVGARRGASGARGNSQTNKQTRPKQTRPKRPKSRPKTRPKKN